MVGRTDSSKGRSRSTRGRSPSTRSAAAAVLASAAILVAGCSSRVVTTDDAPSITPSSSAAAPAPSTRPSNDGLANAFDFAAQSDDQTAYYFITPSKRWACEIIPRERVGCQSATGSTMPVTGAPSSVLDVQGQPSPPNAIVVDRSADPQFTSLDAPGFGLVPGPATVLPFDELLIAAGFRCNVQEASGISCVSELSGKGFTFSADGYTFQYTDLPR